MVEAFAERGEGWQGRCLIFIRIANRSEWMPDQIRWREAGTMVSEKMRISVDGEEHRGWHV